jgi:diketogulonate reductase-like aldo/keto reductase
VKTLFCKIEGKNSMDMIKLSNDVSIPNLCYGTDITYLRSTGIRRKIDDLKCRVKIFIGKDVYCANKNLYMPRGIEECMVNGCKLFDTSRAYGASEFNLGYALRKYSRKTYYVVTKLNNDAQYTGRVREALFESLRELNMNYVDVYLMHWPVEGHYIESWKQMEKLYKEGYCKAIGVCNFNIHHLEELKKRVDIMPMINQFECHPLFTQNELRAYCHDNNIQVMAYTSTARMDSRLKTTCLVPIAEKYNKTVAQIILRWHQQIGNIPIVNSTKEKHIRENCNISDFKLTDDEINEITRININSRLRYDPDNCDFRQL